MEKTFRREGEEAVTSAAQAAQKVKDMAEERRVAESEGEKKVRARRPPPSAQSLVGELEGRAAELSGLIAGGRLGARLLALLASPTQINEEIRRLGGVADEISICDQETYRGTGIDPNECIIRLLSEWVDTAESFIVAGEEESATNEEYEALRDAISKSVKDAQERLDAARALVKRLVKRLGGAPSGPQGPSGGGRRKRSKRKGKSRRRRSARGARRRRSPRRSPRIQSRRSSGRKR